MSKFSIYRIDHYDPLLLGKKRRRLNVFFGLMSLLFAVIYLIVHLVLKVPFEIAYPSAIAIIGSSTIVLYIKLKKENSKFKIIGDIEFTRSGIIKNIGEISNEYNYESISDIELTKHIPAIDARKNKSGFMTYILTINFNSGNTEKYIVSDLPVGKFRNISISETIKTLKKISSTKIMLN